MAQIEVKVPDIGDYDGVPVIEVLVAVGDTVVVDQGLVTLESEKATMEVPSSVAGVVKELRVKVDDTVADGAVIAVIEVQDDGEGDGEIDGKSESGGSGKGNGEGGKTGAPAKDAGTATKNAAGSATAGSGSRTGAGTDTDTDIGKGVGTGAGTSARSGAGREVGS